MKNNTSVWDRSFTWATIQACMCGAWVLIHAYAAAAIAACFVVVFAAKGIAEEKN